MFVSGKRIVDLFDGAVKFVQQRHPINTRSVQSITFFPM